MRPMKPRQPGSIYEALARAMVEIGESQGQPNQGLRLVADFEGKASSTLYHELDPDYPTAEMSLLSASRWARHFKVRALAEYFAIAADGVFMPLPRADIEPRWSELTAEAVEDMGRIAADMMRDLSPTSPGGHTITTTEAKRMLPLLHEMQRHMAGLTSMAQAVADAREGGR